MGIMEAETDRRGRRRDDVHLLYHTTLRASKSQGSHGCPSSSCAAGAWPARRAPRATCLGQQVASVPLSAASIAGFAPVISP